MKASLRAVITASSHTFRPTREGDALVDIKAELDSLCRQKHRRVDRFIGLALVGAARCVGSRELTASTGVYLCSGCGPVGNNVAVQEQLFKLHQPPKPFNFVNTLGNIGGFYLSKEFNLDGQSFFLSTPRRAFVTTLRCALTDLALGIVPAALVGVVEEGVYPLDEQRRRLNVADGTPLAEGTHWFLLEKEGEGCPVALKAGGSREEILAELESGEGAIALAAGTDDPRLKSAVDFGPDYHGSLDAALLSRRIEEGNKEKIRLVYGDASGSWQLLDAF